MSQERHRKSPHKASPLSRIPLPSSVSSSSKKRPVSLISKETNVSAKAIPSSKIVSSGLSGFRKLEALAKAEAKSRHSPEESSLTKSGNPWVEKHLPTSVDDLFVHKKKVEEVTNWLKGSLASPKANKICVLSGPAGCGKTATIFLVGKLLEADVKEWTNPMSLTDRSFNPNDYESRREEVQGRTELELFKDFLEINSHYRILPINGLKMKNSRVIVVEDLPNSLYRDPTVFHEIVRNYAKNGSFPLVFIITDTVNSGHSMFKMFPKTLMMESKIHNVSFNPVASTLMVKFLLDIVTKESKPIDRSQVEEIAATSNGDIRCAINNLQFFLTKERVSSGLTGGFRRPPAKRSHANSKKGSVATATSEVQQKDDTIQLFKALGKVLYAKRDETVISDVEMQLSNEQELERRIHPLLEDPDNIATKIEVAADTFLGFLHQNYPAFYGSMDDLRVAAEYLSASDFILSGWKFDDSGTRTYKIQEAKEQVSLNIAIRGIMHSNCNRVSSGWKPLTKPLVSNMDNYTRDSIENTRQTLYHLHELQTTLFTEAIPFYAKLLQLKPSFNMDGRREILDRGLIEKRSIRVESLDEKETVEDMDSSNTPESEDAQNIENEAEKVVKTDLDAKNSDSDEEFEIEEYAD